MSAQLSVAQVLANLEAQMAFHKEQQAHHAEQESFHREQQAIHAAEFETVAKHYEAFKATAEAAAAIAARTAAAPAPEPAQQDETPPVRVAPTRPGLLVTRWVAELPAEEVITPSRAAKEINRRFRRELRKPIDSRTASSVLRRLLSEGAIRLVEKGTAHREALYSKK